MRKAAILVVAMMLLLAGCGEGDWLQVREGASVPIYDEPGGKVVARAADRTQFGSPMSFGVLGERDGGDWIEVTTALGPPNEPLWVRANPKALRTMETPWSIDVDLGERRLELRRDDVVVRTAGIAIGRAESPTPTGRFAVTDVIVRDLDHATYGCCALALSAHQPSLPAGWIGGDRVAIHGTPASNDDIGVAASAGCIRVRDEELIPIVRRAGLGTPVTIRG